jgi:hypothetical protein
MSLTPLPVQDPSQTISPSQSTNPGPQVSASVQQPCQSSTQISPSFLSPSPKPVHQLKPPALKSVFQSNTSASPSPQSVYQSSTPSQSIIPQSITQASAPVQHPNQSISQTPLPVQHPSQSITPISLPIQDPKSVHQSNSPASPAPTSMNQSKHRASPTTVPFLPLSSSSNIRQQVSPSRLPFGSGFKRTSHDHATRGTANCAQCEFRWCSSVRACRHTTLPPTQPMQLIKRRYAD